MIRLIVSSICMFPPRLLNEHTFQGLILNFPAKHSSVIYEKVSIRRVLEKQPLLE
jgi:hypothetical protein